MGSAVAEFYNSEGLARGMTLRSLGIPNKFVEQGTQAELRAMLGIDAEGIDFAARALLRP